MAKLYSSNKKAVLITGASSGFGKACGKHLSQRGYRVYGTSRKAEFDDETGPFKDGENFLKMIPMDVRDQSSVDKGIDYILRQENRVDAIVNNAGFGIAGSVEDCSIEELKSQFETNFFGVVRVCQAVLPQMRKQEFGHIIMISSIGGLMGIPYQGAYSASKFALEGIAESLSMEVKPFGINIVLIEPGDFKTEFTDNRIIAKASQGDSVYSIKFKRALAVFEEGEINGPPPEKLAFLLENILNNPAPKSRYVVGILPQRSAAILKRLLPAGMFEWIMMKSFNVS